MTSHHGLGRTPVHRVWLRRGGPTNPWPHGSCHGVRLTEVGIAAARETLVTATPHMAAIWTDLFESLVVPGCELRWADNGPGIGRDARIAYSGLLGRYMARAFLTENAGIRVLVPLDVAKRCFIGSPYLIKKDPPGRGLEADWIGLDGQGLVIVEAKGTYDPRFRAWHGPQSLPHCLQTAIAQAGRTAVFAHRPGPLCKLPAKRWAIASRWGTEDKPELRPTLLTWSTGVSCLSGKEYRELEELLLHADVGGVIGGLGYSEGVKANTDQPLSRLLGRGQRLRVGDLLVERGFASILGPFGVRPLRGEDELRLVHRALQNDIGIAIASLSERYLSTVVEGREWSGVRLIGAEREDTDRTADAVEDDVGVASAIRAGLTVAWPRGDRTAIELQLD